MTVIHEGSIQSTISYNLSDLEELKAQVDSFIQSNPDVQSNLNSVDSFLSAIKAEMYVGLKTAGIWIADTASASAPIETGLLRSSGSVWLKSNNIHTTGGGNYPSHVDTPELSVIIIFNTPYAFVQDTNPTFHHPRGGRAGYLTGTIRENHNKIQEMLFAPLAALFIR